MKSVDSTHWHSSCINVNIEDNAGLLKQKYPHDVEDRTEHYHYWVQS